MDILDSYKIMSSNLKNIMQMDIAIGLTNLTEFLAYYPADSFDLKAKPGQKLQEGEPLWQTIKENKTLAVDVPEEFYGRPIKAITSPIKDENGKLVGAIAIGIDLKEKNDIEQAVKNLFSSLEETNVSIQEVSEGSQKLSTMIHDIVKYVNLTGTMIKESAEIIKMIQNIATQSNLLGLNAAIEASRAGELGRGFSVVASEMRKLSQISKESSKKVSTHLTEMLKSIKLTIDTVENLEIVSQDQTAVTEEITTASQKLAEYIGEFKEYAGLNQPCIFFISSTWNYTISKTNIHLQYFFSTVKISCYLYPNSFVISIFRD